MSVATLQGTDNHCILDLRTQAGTYVKVLRLLYLSHQSTTRHDQ